MGHIAIGYDQYEVEEMLKEYAIKILSDPELLSKAGLVKKKEWISVEDRLPPVNKKFGESDYVLCLDDTYNQCVCWYEKPSNKWVLGHHRASSEPINVTHWLPLPSPPQNKEQ